MKIHISGDLEIFLLISYNKPRLSLYPCCGMRAWGKKLPQLNRPQYKGEPFILHSVSSFHSFSSCPSQHLNTSMHQFTYYCDKTNTGSTEWTKTCLNATTTYSLLPRTYLVPFSLNPPVMTVFSQAVSHSQQLPTHLPPQSLPHSGSKIRGVFCLLSRITPAHACKRGMLLLPCQVEKFGGDAASRLDIHKVSGSVVTQLSLLGSNLYARTITLSPMYHDRS